MAEKWASELFKCGYNCSQSVFAAHAAKFGIDTATALKLSAPLGGGVGRMREVCGAFSACAMLLVRWETVITVVSLVRVLSAWRSAASVA